MKTSLLSIITINYNDLEGLKKTMHSVFEQTSSAYEYIVIDGGSTDGSKEYIASQKTKINHWLSEKDQGPYDAMNKGIDIVNGDYVLFLNAGDVFYNNTVINTFINSSFSEDIIYGDTILDDKGVHTFKQMPEVYNMMTTLTNTINHQSIFFSKRLFENGHRYDTSYKIVADWTFINDAIIFRNATVKHINVIISIYDVNGLSSNKSLRYQERRHYIKNRFGVHFTTLLEAYNSKSNELLKFKNKPLIKQLLAFKNKLNKLKGKE